MNASEDVQSIQASSISQAQSLEQVAEFWETHSLADYWDQTREVEFQIRANATNGRRLTPIRPRRNHGL